MYRINLKLSFLFCLVQFFSDFPELPFISKNLPSSKSSKQSRSYLTFSFIIAEDCLYKRFQLCVYTQTYPESRCKCCVSLIHSAQSRSVPYRQMDLHLLPRSIDPADVELVVLNPGALAYNPLVQTHVQQSGWLRRKPVAWSMAIKGLLKAQMFRMVCGPLLEEEKVQRVYLNRGSINWLTHLPNDSKLGCSS